MSLISASASSPPCSVSLVGSYARAPRPSICCEMRTELPVGGGGPNTPSLLSSDRMKIVSHDCQCRRISFRSESAAAQHLLRDADGIAGGRRRPEHAFIVVLRQDEDRQPRLPVPQHLLLLRPEPARALDARRLRQDGAQARREVQLLEGEPGELGQRAIE